MPLTDVQAYFPTGTKVSLASRYTSTYVRKANIFFVAEQSCRRSEMAVESGERRRLRRSRTKKTIAAEIHMPPYIIKGKIHAEM